MTEKEKTSVLDCIDKEGFDYTFIDYSTFSEIKDKRFHQLREEYIKAREELEHYIESQ